MDRIKTQFAKALVADFSENTWTFEMEEGYKVRAGEFAISDKNVYNSMVKELGDYIHTLEVCKTMPNFDAMQKLKMLEKAEGIKQLLNLAKNG
jgi:hypothetical protein